jgi:hypothetical protein
VLLVNWAPGDVCSGALVPYARESSRSRPSHGVSRASCSPASSSSDAGPCRSLCRRGAGCCLAHFCKRDAERRGGGMEFTHL